MRASSVAAAAGTAMLLLSTLLYTVAPLAVVIVDLTPPSITFLSPENNSAVYVGTAVSIQVRFEDGGSGVNDVYVRVWDDGQNVAGEVKERLGGFGSYTATLSWTPSKEGTYRIVAGSYDVVGNMSPPRTIYVRVGTRPTYTLAISVNDLSKGTTNPAPGTYSYTEGQQVTVTAVPASGCRFVGWFGDASGTSASVTLTMDRNKSVVANFEAVPQTYTLSVSVSPPGSGAVVDENQAAVTTRTVAGGTFVSLTARPNAGYEFVSWSGDVSGTSSTVTVLVDGNKSVTANFREVQAPSGTFMINGQPVVASTAILVDTALLNFAFLPTRSAEYITKVSVAIDGASVVLTKSGDRWVGSYSLPGEGTYAVNVSLTWARGEVSVCSLVLMYRSHEENNPPGKVNVAVSVSPPNSGSVVGNYGMVDRGTVVELYAFPNEGYRFVGWRGDVAGASPKLVLVADRDMDIQAVFELSPEERWKQEARTLATRYISLGLAALGAMLLVLSFTFRVRGR